MKCVLTLIAMILFSSVSYAETSYGNLTAVVTRIYDGDTFYVNINDVPTIFGTNIPVRLRGVDTPEIHGKCDTEKVVALQAKKFVEEQLPTGSTIILHDVSRDKYFRILATIKLNDNSDLSQLLIDKNLGFKYGDVTSSWCK